MSIPQNPDLLELKASLLVEGVKASKSALTGLGTKYKEQNHGLFGWDMEDHGDLALPDDFRLPDGSIVQFRMNSSSPFCVQVKDEALVLSRNGCDVCEVEWIKRPAFYDLRVEQDKKMIQIGQIGGEVPLKMPQVHPIVLLSLGTLSAPAEHKFLNGLFS